MHDTAYKIGGRFLQKYLGEPASVLELGSFNVNGSLRDFARDSWTYIGVDFEVGPSVDVCIAPSEDLPFADATFDAVLATSVLEHDPAFWCTILEAMRVLKPNGFLYINAPSNGTFHRYPRDYWRFYPDSGEAFVRWIRKAGVACHLAESFVSAQGNDGWNDFVAVLAKSSEAVSVGYRLADEFPSENVRLGTAGAIIREVSSPEDQRRIRLLRSEVEQIREQSRVVRDQLLELRAGVEHATTALARVTAPFGPLYDGAVDGLSATRCSGWALDLAKPSSSVLVKVVANEKIVGTCLASQFRQDLFDAGYGSGCFGFDIAFGLAEVGEVKVEVLAELSSGTRRMASKVIAPQDAAST